MVMDFHTSLLATFAIVLVLLTISISCASIRFVCVSRDRSLDRAHAVAAVVAVAVVVVAAVEVVAGVVAVAAASQERRGLLPGECLC